MDWIDLFIEGDTHPRRFEDLQTLCQYVMKVERLSEEAADALLSQQEVAPPLARRSYFLKQLKAVE